MEIKFKVWDKKNKKMIDFGDIEFLITGGYHQLSFPDSDADPEGWEKWSIYDDYDFLQFTGLYDKNDKEIYRGDVLLSSGLDKTINIKQKILKGRKSPMFVLFKDGSFKLKKENKRSRKYNLFGGLILRFQFEVIGNIYENPELIK
jgi:uncharacterized phage protein (TIGR01671 family)